VLDAYLNDHLARAVATCELAEGLDERFRATPRGPAFRALRAAVDDDRRALEAVMADLGIPQRWRRQAVGWLGERLSGTGRGDADLDGTALAAVLEMEALGAGITGTRAMWVDLCALAAVEPRLRPGELGRLVARAEEQRAALERERTSFAVDALLAAASSWHPRLTMWAPG
jgi:hypothetical protein